MMNFSPSTIEDIPQLTEWIANDPYHFHQGQPEWWITGAEHSLLSFCLMDARGPLAYVRLDREGEYIRIHTQFAPKSVVSNRRLVVGMIGAVKKLEEVYYLQAKGFVFNSVSANLIAFMGNHLNFTSVGNDDYQLDFEGQ
jgi:hypothetical protein